jgi:hypothetical protein
MKVWVLQGNVYGIGSLGVAVAVYSTQEEANKHLDNMNQKLTKNDSYFWNYWIEEIPVKDKYNA